MAFGLVYGLWPVASFAQTDAITFRSPNTTPDPYVEYVRLRIQTTTSGAGVAGTANMYLTNAYLGVGATAATDPATPIDIIGTNAIGLRLRGADTANEYVELYVQSSGQGTFNLTGGTDTGQFFDLRTEDDGLGFVLRESDGTGTAAYLNIYVVDGTRDYANFVLSATNATAGFVIADGSDFGFGTVDPDGVQINVAVSETARAVDNVRIGVEDGTPRIILEDSTFTQWEMDNSAGTFRFLTANDTARLTFSTTTGTSYLHWRPSADNTYDLGTTSYQWRNTYVEKAGIGTTTLTGVLNSTESGAKTAANYAAYISNTATNTTTNGINKYGAYVTSTGSFTGSTGANTINYGLYVTTDDLADYNVALRVDHGLYVLGGGGDLNESGTLTSADNILFLNHLGAVSIFSATDYAEGDINGDGRASYLDRDLLNDMIFLGLSTAYANHDLGKFLSDATLSVHRKVSSNAPPTILNSGWVEVRTNNIGTTIGDDTGISLINETEAAAGAQQFSPPIWWQGRGWNTGTSSSNTLTWRAYVVPVEGTANPSGYLTFESASTNRLTLDSSIKVGIATTTPATSLDVNGDWGAQYTNMTALANGNNNNLDINNTSYVRVSGPTGAFTITGIADGYDGKRLIVYNNTTQNMSLTNNDANSTAANQIRIMDGATKTTTGAGTAELIYDATTQRWHLLKISN